MFNGCIPKIVLDLKLGNTSQQAFLTNLQKVEHVFEETEMIYKIFRKNAMQAYIKMKPNTIYDKNVNASKFKQAHYVSVLQPKSDY